MKGNKIAKAIISPLGTLIVGILFFLISPMGGKLFSISSLYGLKVSLMYFTGVIAIVGIVFATVLSARFNFVNKWFGGLDKAYSVHKKIAAVSFVFAFFHFCIFLGGAILKATGIIVKNPRNPNFLDNQAADIFNTYGLSAFTNLENFTTFMVSMYHAAYKFIIPAFIILFVIIVITMTKKIPYNIFRIAHKFIPFIFLFFAFHAFMTTIRGGWLVTIPGILFAILLLIGVIVSLLLLLGVTESGKNYKGQVTKVIYHDKDNSTEINIKLIDKKMKYNPGQFVYLSFTSLSEPHPFSIANYDEENRLLKFFIRQSGDYTFLLKDVVKEGEKVDVTGPYGEFDFTNSSSHNKNNKDLRVNQEIPQLWIAGGIGITPFIARLEYLALINTKKGLINKVDDKDNHLENLIDSKSNVDEINKNNIDNIDNEDMIKIEKNGSTNITFIFSYIGESFLKSYIEKLCNKANVNLIYYNTSKEGLIDFEKIVNYCPDLKNRSIWFCGPTPFLKMVKTNLKNIEFNLENFHFDVFNMR